MLTAMVSVDNILAGVTDKSNLWEINTEQEYHEDKTPPAGESVPAGAGAEVAEDNELAA